jgi:hypothetical protein
MQRRVATFLAGVVGRGAGVFATTHSDFIVGEINNLIRSRVLVASHAPSRQGGSPESKKPTVRALRFSREGRWCVGRPLEIDSVDGIDESTFTDVMESLYDDSAQLINELKNLIRSGRLRLRSGSSTLQMQVCKCGDAVEFPD